MKLWEEWKEKAEQAEKKLEEYKEKVSGDLDLLATVTSHRADFKTYVTMGLDRRQAWKLSQTMLRQLSEEKEETVQIEFFAEM